MAADPACVAAAAESAPPQRIIVVGSTAAGKSTLASTLATRIGGTFVELDALNFEGSWKTISIPKFQDKLRALIAPNPNRWAVAGHYPRKAEPILWPQAQVVVWLDFPLYLTFWRLTTRTVRRWWTQELLWGQVRENLWDNLKFWNRESLFHGLVADHWSRKELYPQLLAKPEYKHLTLLRFQHPQELDQWVERTFPAGAAATAAAAAAAAATTENQKQVK